MGRVGLGFDVGAVFEGEEGGIADEEGGIGVGEHGDGVGWSWEEFGAGVPRNLWKRICA